MSSELIINSSRDKSRIGLLKDKKLVEFHQESDETKFNVGDIYVGKVKKINKSLNAAFIDIGFEKDLSTGRLVLISAIDNLVKGA